MIIGVPKELKSGENRVAVTPAGVEVLRAAGHRVLIELGAGQASGFDDAAFHAAGAEVLEDLDRIYHVSEMVLRVKEPQPPDFGRLREGQVHFSFLHLAASRAVAQGLIQTKTVALAYETIEKDDGSLPLLTPMSEVAGPMAIQEGAKYLEMAQGGLGVLLGGVPGVDPGNVVILGAGKVGASAAKKAAGLGAKVFLLDVDLDRLRYLSDVLPKNCFLLMSHPATVRDLITRADLVIGAVLVPGSRTPTLIARDQLKTMKTGAVLVDVSIDQGGCFESSRETTHAQPTYNLDGIVHYAVSNMPAAVPKTATLALTNATLPYVLEIAAKGWARAARENLEIKMGVNVAQGHLTYPAVARDLGLASIQVDELLP